MPNFFNFETSLELDAWKSAKGRVGLGLCCINNTLKKQYSVNNSCIQRTFTVDRALELSTKNVSNISPILKWNHEHNIKHYRLSSDMFPHFTNPNVEKYTPTEEIKTILRETGDLVKQLGHRITMHPGQFNQIATPKEDVWEKTVFELEHHAWIMDTMGIGKEGILCIHGGGVFGDKEGTIRRWIDRFDDLPQCVKNRLAIENCEHCYYVRDCLDIAQACKIPMIYDSHHYYCYRHLHPDEKLDEIEDMLPEIVESWKGVNPLFHISDQKMENEDGQFRIGAHHDYIDKIPPHILRVPRDFNVNIDIEVEAKAKEAAIFDLHKRYHLLF